MAAQGTLITLARRLFVAMVIVGALTASCSVGFVVSESLRGTPATHAYLIPRVMHRHVIAKRAYLVPPVMHKHVNLFVPGSPT